MKKLTGVLILVFALSELSAQALSKRLQKEKAAFEAQIAAEEKFNTHIKNADAAFRNHEYAKARENYALAMQYDLTKQAWLISKINDLDILMAEEVAELVDTVKNETLLQMPQVLEAANSTLFSERESFENHNFNDSTQNHSESLHQSTANREEIANTRASKDTLTSRLIKKDTLPAFKNEPVSQEASIEANIYQNYPAGITEEIIEMTNHTIQRIVVVDINEIIVYKRVKHSWGGDFTFKNNLSISPRIWLEEIERYRKKFEEK